MNLLIKMNVNLPKDSDIWSVNCGLKVVLEELRYLGSSSEDQEQTEMIS